MEYIVKKMFRAIENQIVSIYTLVPSIFLFYKLIKLRATVKILRQIGVFCHK